MDRRSELDELIIQAAERLRFYEEQGITDLPRRQTPVKPSLPAQASEPVAHPTAQIAGDTVSKELFADSASSESSETLEQIRSDLGDCRRCKLWRTRTNVVFGEGNPRAELMFVGEAPGADEDATGRPFVGRAGKLLDKMIEAIGMKREQVYIANVVKSRPPENREPERDEVTACSPFVFRQIAVIRPRLIVTLGNPATRELLETRTGISRLRGNLQDYPRVDGIKVLPTFHPAYLLRSPDKKREAWEDLKKVRAFLKGEPV
jgi:uracil-DNA glycosylase